MPDKNNTAGPIEEELMRVYDHQFPISSMPRTIEVIARWLDALSSRLDTIERRQEAEDAHAKYMAGRQ